MTYVVTSACFGCKNTDCVADCPSESFHEGDQMLFIDPDSCVDCDLCRITCPEEAIFPEDDVPADQHDFIELNEEISAQLPSITEKKMPLS